jgi:hypothetical protein
MGTIMGWEMDCVETALHYGVVTNCISGVSFVIALHGIISHYNLTDVKI